VVIEEFMAGEEVALFALCDGKQAMLFGAAQDHKRAFDGDQGPNTGGMGAFSPAAALSAAQAAGAERTIIAPALEGLAAEG
jgi:phosphoribosylamine--glycine ligase